MFAGSMTGTNGSNAFDNANARVELLRAVGLCHPGWNRLRGLTFAPDSSSCPAWLPWKERIFATILWPRIAEARSACAAGDLRALADCDQAIDSALPASFRARELSGRPVPAGALLGAEVRETLAALPRADRFRRRSWAPGYPLCVARSDLPSFIRSAISGAYIFLEAKAGLPRSGVDLWVSMVVDCLTTQCGPKISGLRAA